jgi:hypothetical protein
MPTKAMAAQTQPAVAKRVERGAAMTGRRVEHGHEHGHTEGEAPLTDHVDDRGAVTNDCGGSEEAAVANMVARVRPTPMPVKVIPPRTPVWWRVPERSSTPSHYDASRASLTAS